MNKNKNDISTLPPSLYYLLYKFFSQVSFTYYILLCHQSLKVELKEKNNLVVAHSPTHPKP